MKLEIDPNTRHLRECSAYGGFDCDCQERVERAIIAWARQYRAWNMSPEHHPSMIDLDYYFELLDKEPWR